MGDGELPRLPGQADISQQMFCMIRHRKQCLYGPLSDMRDNMCHVDTGFACNYNSTTSHLVIKEQK